jgi:hypothetical protein
MQCLPKNIPSDIILASGNRGIMFFKSGCNFLEEPLCSIVLEENSEIFLLKEESNEDVFDPVLVHCNV